MSKYSKLLEVIAVIDSVVIYGCSSGLALAKFPWYLCTEMMMAKCSEFRIHSMDAIFGF